MKANKLKLEKTLGTKLYPSEFAQMEAVATHQGESLYSLARKYILAGLAKDLKKVESAA
jgi:hypothetical protein